MRILLVDDAQDTRTLYSLIFTLEGFETQTAKDGQEALMCLQRSRDPFNVIVLDIEMPRMDGWQALKAIRLLPQGQCVPIIMFTAFGSVETRRRALDEGANRLVHKPMLPDEMIQMLREVQAPFGDKIRNCTPR
jgi:CheY-like chemotaxis protein